MHTNQAKADFDKSGQYHVQNQSEADVRERNRKLNLRLDIRILPLCCWIYLLNFLDRGNIGNARVLNSETGDDLLTQTGTTANGYAITLTMFSLAYALFEVPSNWVMKHYVRPSLWLGFLLAAWGAVTIGFAGVQNYASVLSLRLLIGIVSYLPHCPLLHIAIASRNTVLPISFANHLCANSEQFS